MRIILILFFTSIYFIGSSQEVFSPNEKNGKWGYISSTSNKVIIPHQFDLAKKFKKNGFAEVKKNSSWGLINRQGKIIIPLNYSSIERSNFFPRSGYWVELNGKFGMIDINGNSLMPMIFPEPPIYFNRGIFYFQNKNPLTITGESFFPDGLKYKNPIFEEFFITQNNGKLGITNILKNEIIIPHEYERIEPVSSCNLDYLKVWKDKKFGLIDISNKIIIPIEFANLYASPSYNLAAVLKDRKWALMNLEGEYYSSFEIDRVQENLGKEPFPISKNGKWGFVDRKGKTVIPFKYDWASGFGNIDKQGGRIIQGEYKDPCMNLSQTVQAHLLTFVGLDGNRYVMNLDEELFRNDYHAINLEFEYGLKTFKDINGRTGIKNKKNELVLPAKYGIKNLRNGFIYLSTNNKPGFFFPNNNKVLFFDYIERYTGDSTNTRWVKINENIRIINNDGDFVSSEIYDRAGVLKEGFRPVTKNGKVGFLNDDGIEIIPLKYNQDLTLVNSSFIENGILIVYLNGKYGFIDANGKQLKPFEYDAIPYFKHGIAIVFKDGKWGKINFRK